MLFMRVPTLVSCVGVIAPQTLRTSTLPQALAPTEVQLLVLTHTLHATRKDGALVNFLTARRHGGSGTWGSCRPRRGTRRFLVWPTGATTTTA